MRHLVIASAIAALLAIPAGLAGQTAPAAGSSLGNVTLPRPVLANGQTLVAGTYQIRLSGESPTPAVGQSPDGSRYVEFVRNGQVVAREVATVVSGPDAAQIVKGGRPAPGGSRVELLRGGDYMRVWINRGGVDFIIHMPPAPTA